jgi:hypothetical protein
MTENRKMSLKEKIEQRLGRPVDENMYWAVIHSLTFSMPPKPEILTQIKNYYYIQDEAVLGREAYDYILNCAASF